MTDWIAVQCPYCGQPSELNVDDSGWSRQSYVQDCPVCCQPWEVELRRDEYGDWSAELRAAQ